jgi:nucleoside-diphosphate-sugar epimerase
MKRILLTGSTGFIATHLRPLLREQGHEVFNLERYVTGRIGKTLPYQKDTYFADLNDVSALTKAVTDVNPQIVIHLGAMTAVAYSYAHPQETLETNFLGTVNLAEICTKLTGLEQFIFASSAEVYGMSQSPIKKETDGELVSNSPYAVSKLASEKYLTYLYKAFNFPITIFRPFNSYGRKDDTWFVIERTIVQMLTSDKCYLGDPDTVRDFLYVEDQTNAYLYALNNLKAIGETFNISSGRGVTIRELTEIIKDLTGFKGAIIWNTLPKRALDIQDLIGSNEKIKSVLGVPEPIPLEEGLKRTVTYWKKRLTKQ